MKKLIITLIVLSLGFYLSSCTKKIDGTSQEKLQTSLQDVSSNLEGAKMKRFNQSLMLYLFDNSNIFQLSTETLEVDDEPYEGVNQMNYSILKGLDGMTAEEVIAEGKRIAKQKVDTLYRKKQKAKEHEKKLEKFQVQKANLYAREGYLGDENVIELTVKNGTKHPISRVYFNGEYKSPDRSVPWHKGEFNYEIPGGLEPGEGAEWNLKPNMLSDCTEVDIREGANLKIEVLRLDGPEGNKLYSSDIFDEEDKKLLNKLVGIFPELKRDI